MLELEPLAKKWEAFGFGVTEVNGHDVIGLRKSITHALHKPKKPQIIICHTVKGKGILSIKNDMDWHHKTKLSDEDVASLYKELSSYS